MEERHPKRRIDKDNPYKIYKEAGKAYVEFEDGEGISRKIEIDGAIYEALDQFELDDLKQMNEFDRHMERFDIYGRAVEHLSLHMESLESSIIRVLEYEKLEEALSHLSEKQRRRIELRYFNHLSDAKIAKLENCSERAVRYTIYEALEALRKFF